MPNLSILIVSYNSCRTIGQCLDSVAEQTRTDHEVIVIDNASVDGTPSFVAQRYPKARLEPNSVNHGFAIANNQGLKLATGRFRVLLNPDTVLRDRTLDRMVEFMEAHPQVGVVGGKMVESDGSLRRYETWFPSLFSYLANSILLRMRGDQGSQEVDFVSGSCLMMRQEAIEHVGLLDEGFFMYSEDVDWCLRAKKAGWKVYHYAEAQLFHLAGGSSGRDVAARVVNIHQAKLYFFRKHYSGLSYRLLKVIVFFESLAKIFFDAATFAWVGRQRRLYKKDRMRGYARLVQSLFHAPVFVKPAA